MKRKLTVVAAVLAASSLAWAQPTSPLSTPEEQVRGLAQQLLQSPKQKSFATLDRIAADDVIFVDTADRILTKAQVKAEFSRFHAANVTAAEHSRITGVRVHGDTAVVTGKSWLRPTTGQTVRLSFINIFSKRNGNWRLVEAHTILIQ